MNSPPLVKITDEVINTLKRELPEDSDFGPLRLPPPEPRAPLLSSPQSHLNFTQQSHADDFQTPNPLRAGLGGRFRSKQHNKASHVNFWLPSAYKSHVYAIL